MKWGLARKLKNIVGPENFSQEPHDLVCYSYDASGLSFVPDAVALPGSRNEVSELLYLANKEEVPVYARGAGSGTTGAFLAEKGGLVISLTRMNRIISIRSDDLMAEVEPGVVTGHLQAEAARTGLFYPPDPASLSFCTIGGNVATGAGGARAVKYGVTKDYVLALEAVLPGGKIIKAGSKTAKGVVGYDLTRLLVGSEGTLAVVTEITLKLLPLPDTVNTILAFFPDSTSSVDAVSAIFEEKVLPRCAEFMDSFCLELIKNHARDIIPERAQSLLLIELDGNMDSVRTEMEKVERVLKEIGALSLYSAKSPSEARNFWAIRRGLSPSIKQLGFSGKISEDISVPRHSISVLLAGLDEISEKTGIKIITFGHIGDGNLHVNCLFSKEDKKNREKADEAVRRIFELTISLGGTISGEHGIGITKRPFIGMELDMELLNLMKGIKKVFDPKNILNPGKVFP